MAKKSKYDTHVLPYLEKISEWARAGASQNEIADKLHIAHSTFKLYLSKGEKGEEPFSDLSACFARACEEPDDAVEAAMYKSCLGYNAPIIKHYKLKTVEYDPDTGKRIREVETLVEARDEVHVPANTAAQMFWLANRRPRRWSYKPEGGDDSGESGVVFLAPVAEMPKEPDGGAADG